MVIPELCAWGLCFELIVLFIFNFLFGPPLLTGRLITGQQTNHGWEWKRASLYASDIPARSVQLCWFGKNSDASKGAEHTNTDLQLSMKAIMLQAYERALQPNQINAARMKAFLVCQLAYSTLVQFCPRRLIITQTTEETGLTGITGHLHQWCWHETSCASAYSCAERGGGLSCLWELEAGVACMAGSPAHCSNASLLCCGTTCLPPWTLFYCR